MFGDVSIGWLYAGSSGGAARLTYTWASERAGNPINNAATASGGNILRIRIQ
jgi:hypothetical protein